MKRIILLSGWIFFSMLCFSQINYCIPNRFGEAPYFDTSEIAEQFNITYGNAYNKFKAVSEDLKLDIYYPKTSVDDLPKRPLILYMHGGGFLEGDKSGGAAKCREWARRGFVAASINYRLGWACVGTWAAALCTCPDGSLIKTAVYEAIQDHRAAMRFLAAHANDYGIDISAFFITGESAGSIATMTSYYINQQEVDSFGGQSLHQTLGALDSSSNNLPGGSYRIRGIINNCGAINDTSIMQDSEVLPTISFHDENDCLVPFAKNYVLNCTGNCYYYFPVTGSKLVHDKTLALGQCSKLYEVKNSNLHCSFPGDQLIKKSSCFVRGILCSDCESGFSTNSYDTVPCKQDIATDIENLSRENLNLLQVYPNPAEGEMATLVFEISYAQRATISIMDVLGREISSTTSYCEKGRNTFSIDTKQLPAGVNYCFLRTTFGQSSTILVKQ